MQVAHLLDFQLVDVVAEPHELPRQLLVLQAHVCLMERDRKQLKQPADLLINQLIN